MARGYLRVPYRDKKTVICRLFSYAYKTDLQVIKNLSLHRNS
ncbi:hypothetical protein SBRY_20210 [Actinacidiphila bryophytorum]|uniref:Uncharacterized protein n=1 Tax=Actinacidiphila bryophytorum TaxID=1436133 RepID=A0A9W4EDB0_9ACTN|nr:hypothetical protein SBRY_20210 [Actinacidiphila bryophytorum]